MKTTVELDQKRAWKRCLYDALSEMDLKAFSQKLELAKRAFEKRYHDLNCSRNPDPLEVAELTDALHVLHALEFLKDKTGGQSPQPLTIRTEPPP